ncbi:MAG: MFS transporter [Actinomycetota bacterium]|nr:MFS transporter [Actinomycetota bacterium]
MSDAVVVPPLRRPQFRKLLAISITVALGFGMVIPILPLYARSFGVAIALIGLIQFVFGLTRFSFGLVGGLVVDRFGERACTIAGLLIVSASSFAVGLAQSFPQLVIARGFGGAGSALFIGGLMNRILRIIEPEAMGRATGAFRSSFLVGIALGPLFGGVIAQQLGLAAPFHIYGAGLVVAAVIAWFVMAGEAREVEPERKDPMEALRAARPLFSDQRYFVALLATFVGWWTISGAAQTLGPLFADDVLGFSEQQIGFAVTLLAVGEIAILAIAGSLADRIGRRAVLVPSLVVTAGATALMGQVAGAPWAYYPLMVAIGAGIAAGGVAAGGLLGDSIPRGGSGAALGVNQKAGDVGYLNAPTALGTIAQTTSFSTAFALGALPAAVVAIASLRLPKPHVPTSERVDMTPEPHTVG